MTALFVVAVFAPLIAIVLGALAALAARRRAPTKRTAAGLPYGRQKYLMSAAERSLFGVLEQAVQGEYRIFAKVRVADLLYVTKGATERQGHLNRVTSKHIDFVLCDRDALRPVLAVELDDSSHDAPERQKRDTFLDDAFRAAALPLLHVKASRAYDVAALSEQIRMSIGPSCS